MNRALTVFYWFRYAIWIYGLIILIRYALCGLRESWAYPYWCLAGYLLFQDVFSFFVIRSEKRSSRAAICSILLQELQTTVSKSFVHGQIELSNFLLTIAAIIIPIFIGIYLTLTPGSTNRFLLSGGISLLLFSIITNFLFRDITGGGISEKDSKVEFYTSAHALFSHILFQLSVWALILGNSMLIFYFLFNT